MLAEGIYRARAREWALCEASTGTEQVAVEFALTDEAHAGQGITWYGFLTEKTWQRTVESLRYCGWQGDDLSDLQGLDANEVDLVVEHEADDKGQVRVRVKWVNRVGGLAIKSPMPAEKAKAFAAAMRSKIRGMDAASGKKAPPARSRAGGVLSPEPPPHGALDDIPF